MCARRRQKTDAGIFQWAGVTDPKKRRIFTEKGKKRARRERFFLVGVRSAAMDLMELEGWIETYSWKSAAPTLHDFRERGGGDVSLTIDPKHPDSGQ
jgi:hypothetical protein